MGGIVWWYIMCVIAALLRWIALDTFYIITFILYLYLHYISREG